MIKSQKLDKAAKNYVARVGWDQIEPWQREIILKIFKAGATWQLRQMKKKIQATMEAEQLRRLTRGHKY